MKKIIFLSAITFCIACQNPPAPSEAVQEQTIQDAISAVQKVEEVKDTVVNEAATQIASTEGVSLKGWQLPFNEKPKKTIEDYYYMLPSSMFFERRLPLGDGVEWRKKQIKALDTKNGYLNAKTEFEEFEIGLFKDKKRNKDVIVVLAYDGGNYLYKYEVSADNKMVSNSVLNEAMEAEMVQYFGDESVLYQVDYTLPRQGTTIGMDYNQQKAGLEWRDGEFVFSPSKK